LVPKYTKPEAETRAEIDAKLIAAGWTIQDKKRLNLFEKLGVAVREMDTDTGPADYTLFIDGKACGIVEAKREGSNLGEVVGQSRRYAVSGVKHVEKWQDKLPFTYEATNHEIRFCDWRDPHARSRYVFYFHRPETLKVWLEEGNTLRARLHDLPKLNTENLRRCQIDAIHGIEQSLKAAKWPPAPEKPTPPSPKFIVWPSLPRSNASCFWKEQWSTLPADVKGKIYEGLLERNAQDVKGGAGQYFTPCLLTRAII
jgi:hypothetical protein